MPDRETRHLTILLTDIKGFTDKTSRKSRDDMVAMLDKHKEIVLPLLEERGGRLIKTIGDAFLMVFDSPTDAVLAGVAVQDALHEFNEDKEDDDRIDVRIAINSGEVTVSDGDIFGDAVNITARIESVAEAGEVFFTEAVYLSMNKREVPSSEIGLLQLKGIPERIRAYKVMRETPLEDGGAPAPRTGLWGLLRRKGAPAASPKARALKNAPLASFAARAGALALDVLICWILASSLVATESTQYRVKKKEEPPRFGTDMNEAGRELVNEESDGIEAALAALPASPYTDEGPMAPAGEVLARIAKAANRPIVLDPEADGPVKPDFHGVPLRTAFATVLHRKELAAELAADGSIRVRRAVWAGSSPPEGANVDIRIPGGASISVKTKPGPDETVAISPKGVESRSRTTTQTRTIRLGDADGEILGDETLFESGGVKIRKVRKKRSTAGTILWVLYSTLFLSLWSATPGKKILGLKVVRSGTGEDLDWKTALTRSLLTVVSAAPALLGFAWALFSDKKRCWHDSLAETLVVRAPRP